MVFICGCDTFGKVIEPHFQKRLGEIISGGPGANIECESDAIFEPYIQGDKVCMRRPFGGGK